MVHCSLIDNSFQESSVKERRYLSSPDNLWRSKEHAMKFVY